MNTSKAGLFGVIAGLATMTAAGAAQAASHPGAALMPAASYAELLQPIPNALALLQAAPAAGLGQADGIVRVQYYGNNGNQHYHHAYAPPPMQHHHQYYQRRNYHHAYNNHHHHNDGGATLIVPGIGMVHSGG